MELLFDNALFGFMNSLNLAIAFVMLCYYSLNGRRWNKLARIGWLLMSGGMLAMSIVFVDHLEFDDSLFLYFWAIKNIGIGAFVMGLLMSWSKKP